MFVDKSPKSNFLSGLILLSEYTTMIVYNCKHDHLVLNEMLLLVVIFLVLEV